jgi:hypothetical protein
MDPELSVHVRVLIRPSFHVGIRCWPRSILNSSLDDCLFKNVSWNGRISQKVLEKWLIHVDLAIL